MKIKLREAAKETLYIDVEENVGGVTINIIDPEGIPYTIGWFRENEEGELEFMRAINVHSDYVSTEGDEYIRVVDQE